MNPTDTQTNDEGAPFKDFPAFVHSSLYGGRSDDPEAPENRSNRDFLDGYAEGLTKTGHDPISDKWEEIGSPEELPQSFKEWKRGYNAASLRTSWNNARALPAPPKEVQA